MASKSRDPGKWAEGLVRDWLEQKSLNTAGFAFHRYPDARSAQGPLAAQPADFLVALDGKATHLEVKETKELLRLPKAKIRQYGMLKKFDWAGFDTKVLVYRSQVPDWVVLSSFDLFVHEECPPSFPFRGCLTFRSHAEALKDLFP